MGAVESYRRGKLTAAGAFAGAFLGLFMFIGAGWTGLFFLLSFFLLGTAVTSWKRRQKTASGMAQEAGGRRKLGQVLANGGVGGLLGILSLFFPAQKTLFTLMMAGAFSAAMADTLSSELGTVYGKRFYNIITFKSDKRGLDGVVSWEGTAFGLAGSVLIGFIYALGIGWGHSFLFILIAGTAGNLADSLIGATLERQGVISNDVVNFANTALGALTAFGLSYLFH